MKIIKNKIIASKNKFTYKGINFIVNGERHGAILEEEQYICYFDPYYGEDFEVLEKFLIKEDICYSIGSSDDSDYLLLKIPKSMFIVNE